MWGKLEMREKIEYESKSLIHPHPHSYIVTFTLILFSIFRIFRYFHFRHFSSSQT